MVMIKLKLLKFFLTDITYSNLMFFLSKLYVYIRFSNKQQSNLFQTSLLFAFVFFPSILSSSVRSEEQRDKYRSIRKRAWTEIFTDGRHGNVVHWRALLRFTGWWCYRHVGYQEHSILYCRSTNYIARSRTNTMAWQFCFWRKRQFLVCYQYVTKLLEQSRWHQRTQLPTHSITCRY